MKTTLRLDDALVREAKSRAAAAGQTLAATVEDALRVYLIRVGSAESPGRGVALPRFRGRGLRPGVTLESNARLLDAMESDPAGA